MSIESMISDGLYLMVIGMVFVIIFLTILVQILNMMEKFIDHDEVPEVQSSGDKLNQSTLTAVISAAINKHRQKHS